MDTHRCNLCPFTTNNLSSLSRHRTTRHAMDDTNFICYTCQSFFPSINTLAIHYKTVKHLLNCKRTTNDPTWEPERDLWDSLNSTEKLYSYMFPIEDLPQPIPKRRKTDVKNLRTTPAIIPLTATVKLQDPRLYKAPRSFLDLPGVSSSTETHPDPIPTDEGTKSSTEEIPSKTTTPSKREITASTDTAPQKYTTINPTDFHSLNMNIFDPEEWHTIDETGTTDPINPSHQKA